MQSTERKPRSVGKTIAIVLLSVLLVAVSAVMAFFILRLTNANDYIEKLNRQIEDQKNVIDKKETFGAAMQGLMDKANQLDGVLFETIVPLDDYQQLASQAWEVRWNPYSVELVTADVESATVKLDDVIAAANVEVSTNVTGTSYETVTDQLGAGYVSSVLDSALAYCETEALACVSSADPYSVHFDSASYSEPYMNSWLQTGVAYHEFAHVLQFTNPGPTATAVESFGGDVETMADCFALTYLDGWTLDHQVWVTSNLYYNVNIGYGYTCTDSQKQVIRDWYQQLGFKATSISQ